MADERVIHLSLTEKYAPKWGVREGVRELVQNWYDGARAGNAAGGFLFEHGPITIGINGPETSRVLDCFCCKKLDGQVVGFVYHDDARGRLVLVNRAADSGLARKVLLMGYSSKTNNSAMVGQFGEGLKVGLIALLRNGCHVTLHTGHSEAWRFALENDENFGERVLSVHVEARAEEWMQPYIGVFGEHSVASCLDGIDRAHWLKLSNDFLFLSPPTQVVMTELGTLLLDERYRGQLFVKGFWIADLSNDGLVTGVDFRALEVDRDRRAVLRKQDIESQVSNMWVDAITRNPDLVPRYYEMLKASNVASDVSKVNWFADARFIEAIAARFFEENGPNAFPVAAGHNARKDIEVVEGTLGKRAVVCNDVLAALLTKSPQIGTLTSAVDHFSRASFAVVATVALATEERAVLEHVRDVLQRCQSADFHFGAEDWELVEFQHAGVVAATRDGRIVQISRQLLNAAMVHANQGSGCSGVCMCCETRVLRTLISERASIGTAILEIQHVESTLIDALVASLLRPVLAPPSVPLIDFGADATGADAALAEQNKGLRQALEQQRREYKALEAREAAAVGEANELRRNARGAGSSEMEAVITSYDARVAGLEEDVNREKNLNMVNLTEIARLRRLMLERDDEMQNLKKMLAETQQTVSGTARQLLNAQSDARRLTATIESMKSQTITLGATESSVGSMTEEQLVDLEARYEDNLRCIRKTLTERMEAERSRLRRDNEELSGATLCAVCFTAPLDTVLLPCRHHCLCEGCAGPMTSCPVCRGAVVDRITVFSHVRK